MQGRDDFTGGTGSELHSPLGRGNFCEERGDELRAASLAARVKSRDSRAGAPALHCSDLTPDFHARSSRHPRRYSRHDASGESLGDRGALVARAVRARVRRTTPRRMALVIEEAASFAGISGCTRGCRRVGDREYCGCRSGAAAWTGHSVVGRISEASQRGRSHRGVSRGARVEPRGAFALRKMGV